VSIFVAIVAGGAVGGLAGVVVARAAVNLTERRRRLDRLRARRGSEPATPAASSTARRGNDPPARRGGP
jgi:hypothetical protein